MKKLTLIAFILFISLASNSWATITTYSGGLYIGDGLIATDGWLTGNASFSWVVTYDTESPGYWTYVYTWTGPVKSLSHFDLQVSEGTTFNQVIKSWGTDPTPIFSSTPEGPKILKETADEDNFSFYGIKWETLPDINLLGFTITIESYRNPMWGNFFAKDGVEGGVNVYAYNSLIATPPSNPYAVADGNNGGYALVPDTVVIPEPGSLLLLGTGLLGIAAIRYRRSKK